MHKPFKIFSLSIVLSFGLELIYKELNIDSFYNVVENILFALIIFLVISLFKGIKHRKTLIYVLLVLFNFSLLIESLYLYLFDAYFSVSALFVTLETNFSEAKEFVNSKMDITIFLFSSIFLILTIIQLKKLKIYKTQNLFKSFSRLKIILSLLIILIFLKFSKLITYNLPYLLVKVPTLYFQEMKKFENYGPNNFYGKFTNVKHEVKDDIKELYVIVIGESTNRYHFQLCHNYYRETTPLLNEIKNEIKAFKNVISPHTYTIGSIAKAFTLGNYENPEGKYQGSIVQLFNQAKFKSYWISSQRPVGIMDTHVTKIGTGAYKSIFLNTKHTSDKTILDIELVNALKDIVHEEGNKKVVFLHMLGTHLNYKMRYPKEFEVFKNTPITKYKKKKAFETINAYDNAIRYNDYILRNIIEVVRKENVNGFVSYFSDHGQEVFGDMDFFGHTIDEEISKNMYEIPMFLWTTEDYNLNNSFEFDLNRKYMIDDLIHSIADISNIKSDQIDTTRSIFSKSFKERKRIIKDTIDFDSYYK